MRLFIALIKDELLLGIVKANFNIEKIIFIVPGRVLFIKGKHSTQI